MSKPMRIEKIKNIVLVVLFLSTVLLLYFFWGNISFENFNLPEEPLDTEIPLAKDMIKPDEIIINFGEDNYTVVPAAQESVWSNDTEAGSFVEELARFGQAENILVEEITYAQYLEAMKYRFIRAEFNYDIPLSDFSRNFQLEKPQSFDVISAISTICYSSASPNSLFIHDGKSHKYYRLVAEEDHTEFATLITSIEAEGYNIYYPISIYLGGGDNRTLVPLAVESNLRSFDFKQDTYSYQTEKINIMAESFFGENFDFVRRITEDNGTIIYMYGYGQNVLIVNKDGSFEYKEEQLSDNSEQSFLEALETAVEYVANHGSWESLEGSKMTPYLKDVILNPNKEKGFRFIFGMEVNGTRLFYEEGEPITVDVTWGQVTYYKRSMIDFDQEEMEAIEAASYDEAFSALNLMAENYNYIYDILLQSKVVEASLDQTVSFDNVAALVTKMQIGYVKTADSEETNEIQPVWIVTLGDIQFYFDLYSAEPIGYSNE